MHIIAGFFVANAFFIGIINYGKTGKILLPPLSNNSSVPCIAKKE